MGRGCLGVPEWGVGRGGGATGSGEWGGAVARLGVGRGGGRRGRDRESARRERETGRRRLSGIQGTGGGGRGVRVSNVGWADLSGGCLWAE
jgi:hypothetical protein